MIEAYLFEKGINFIPVGSATRRGKEKSASFEPLTRTEKFIQDIEVINLDNNAVKKFGELKAELRKIEQPVADFDLLIASAAITRNHILVTNNTRHYSRISELKLENWISA